MSLDAVRRTALLLALLPVAGAQSQIWSFGSGQLTANDQGGRVIALLPDGVAPGHHALLIGAPFDTDGQTTGKLWVVDAEDPLVIVDTDKGAPTEELGTSVAAVPDVDGDGRTDYASGMPGAYWPNDGGGYRLYSSATHAMIDYVTYAVSDARLGDSLAGVGDVDGDGVGDILAGGPSLDGPGGALFDPDRGCAVLFSGATGAVLKEWFGVKDSDRFGAAVAALGDLDYDGVPDFAIGVPGQQVGSPFGIANAGACYVYSGADWSLMATVNGGGAEEAAGSAISMLGDRDNDGALEFAVGGPGWSNGKGRVRVYEGLQATLQGTITGLASSMVTDYFGAALAPGGDVDHDGHDDLIVTATRGTTGLNGYAQVISGADWSVIGNTLFGPTGSGFGVSVAGGLDVTGDGWTDAFFGLPDLDSYGTNAGAARGYRFTTIQDNLGFQGPGPTTLSVYGMPLETGGHADLLIEGLPASTPCYLLVSLAQLNAPFKGGVIVPHPAAGLVMILPSIMGTVKIEGLPGGGGPFDVLAQALAKQVSAPKGWWISNAVKMEFLP